MRVGVPTTTLALMRQLAPALLVAAALAGCGSDEATQAGGPTGELANLVVTVDDDGAKGSGQPRELKLDCAKPTDSQACGAAAGVSAADLKPTGADVACTQIYGGPEVATIKGTIRGDAGRRDVQAHRRLRDRALGPGQGAARRGALSYRLTVRRGPKIEKDKRDTLDEALDVLEALRARRRRGARPVDFVSRRYEPGDLVALRIELKGDGVRAGLDVHGDGSRGGVDRAASAARSSSRRRREPVRRAAPHAQSVSVDP